MSTRLAKQLVYGTLYVVIWVLIIWLGYHVFVPATPPPVAAPTIQPIQVLSVQAFPATSGHDTFLAKIANQNSDYAAQSFDYSFTINAASGTVLAVYPSQSFLYGGEVKYLLLVNQPVVIPITNLALSIPTTTVFWVASSSFGLVPDLAVEGLSTTVGSSTVIASGQVVDNDTATFSNIFVVTIFKDANGNPIAASQTELNSIAPNQTENFSISYPVVAGINPAATEVDAYAARD